LRRKERKRRESKCRKSLCSGVVKL
jgi:hypothetical protein